jgi:hypothetical protein
MQSPRYISESGRKVGKESTKPLGFIMPHYFYIYHISSIDFAAIPDYKGWNLLICIGVLV